MNLRKLVILLCIMFGGFLSWLLYPQLVEAAETTTTTFTDSDGTQLTFEIPPINDLPEYSSLPNYIIFYCKTDNLVVCCFYDYEYAGEDGTLIWTSNGEKFFMHSHLSSGYTLQNGQWVAWYNNASNTKPKYSVYKILYCTDDVTDGGTVVFQQRPCQALVAGLTAGQIQEAATAELIGLVPLVIGLVVLATSLYKGFRFLLMQLKAL